MESILRRALRRVVRPPRPDGGLLLVGDAVGWILDDVSLQLARHLPADLHCRTAPAEWQRARNCTIHLIDRAWAWSDGMLDPIDPSNRLIGVWWHGRLDSPDPIIQAALERLRRHHDRFAMLQVTCSSGRETLAALGVPATKVVLLPLGVDLTTFRPVPDTAARHTARRLLGIRDEAVAIGCFQKDGNGWGEGAEPKLIKGPDVFVDALSRLHRRYPVHAVIPGPARGYVKRGLEAAGVPFSAPGMVPRETLPRLYHALDLYCSPSRDEGGPAGALEAMACGIPVVSTRTGIPADLIEPGVSGVLADVDDPDSLTAAAAVLIESPSFRARAARAGLERIEAYDWKRLATRYVDELYTPAQ